MNLYLVRHAIAYDRDAGRWPDDGERPLTPEGIARFAKAARGIHRVAPDVDHVLSSPLVRAWQTAEILADEAGWPAPEAAPELAAAPSDRLLERVRAVAPATLALVGHEPWLSMLLAHLLTGTTAGMRAEFRKGAAAGISFDGPVDPGRGNLMWLAQPKLLRHLAPA